MIHQPVTLSDFPRVIRRDDPTLGTDKPRVVPWIGYKIDKSVQKACVATKTDPSLGASIQRRIEQHMLAQRPLFVHIEQIQDLVEEMLIEVGHPRVALAYGKEQARHATMRLQIFEKAGKEDGQLELTSPALLNDIRRRVSFASLNLSLTMNEGELIARLLRSVSDDLSPNDRQNTIVLNAKSLLDTDADSRFFAARILLTYIYEETLPWKIADGIDKRDPKIDPAAERFDRLTYLDVLARDLKVMDQAATIGLRRLAIATVED